MHERNKKGDTMKLRLTPGRGNFERKHVMRYSIRTTTSIVWALAMLIMSFATVLAQQTGTPTVLPRPDSHFPGSGVRTYEDSDPNGIKLAHACLLEQLLSQFLPGFDHQGEGLGPPLLDARLRPKRAHRINEQAA